MANGLAAAAADVELTSNGDVNEWVRDAANGDEPNPLAVRDALLELAALDRDADEIAALRAQIVERYDEQIGKRRARVEAIRESLTVYATRFGKVSFPDVGGIHLTTKDKGGKARVTDAAAFEAWLRDAELDSIVASTTETIERFNAQDALALALDHFDVKTTADGTLVEVTTGVIVGVPDGVEIVAESKTLAVRKS